MEVEISLRTIRKTLMSARAFVKLTGISKSRLCDIESGIGYIYYDEIKLIAEILHTTPELISDGLLVWDKPIFPSKVQSSIVSSQDNDTTMPSTQQAIISFIRSFPHMYSPTVKEIGAGIGIKSNATVHHHLTKLVKRGLIERRAGCSRCIVLTEGRM